MKNHEEPYGTSLQQDIVLVQNAILALQLQ